jgi:lysophospholipid acyltransferase (LPLAT)-like uncharacterized protein
MNGQNPINIQNGQHIINYNKPTKFQKPQPLIYNFWHKTKHILNC